MIDETNTQEVGRIPSPYEITQNQTSNGGWNKNALREWGVEWPPPEGWKKELENAYRLGQTIGFILECIGCRKAKYFVDHEDYPVCNDCKKFEQDRYDREHNEIRLIRQKRVRCKCKKESIPSDFRWTVFERDNFTCQKCGSRRNLSVDHIFPESMGGKLTMENAQTLCKHCNSKKGAKLENNPSS